MKLVFEKSFPIEERFQFYAHRGSKWVKMITRNVITYEEIRG